MRRVLVGLLVVLAPWAGAAAQDLPVLRVAVSVVGEDGRPTPVVRHALLVSPDPATAPPRRVLTGPDGTAQLPLRAGRYLVESDRPFVVGARAYEWVQTVEVVAGGETTLALTAANATIATATADARREAASASAVPVARTAAILTTWEASTFGIWTPFTHAAGFLADGRGLVATSLSALRDATDVEVQVSALVKVPGVVVARDPDRGVALIRVHPSTITEVQPIPLACDTPATRATSLGPDAITAGVDRPDHDDADAILIEVPMRGPRDATSVAASSGGQGGPVFLTSDRAIGLAAPVGAADTREGTDVRVVPAAVVCAVLASAGAALDASAPPSATRLPVEPVASAAAPSAPETAMPGAARSPRPVSLAPYQLSSADFDITFVTPRLRQSAESRRGWTGGGGEGPDRLRVATEFDDWSDYVEDAPPLLFVRVTPRLVEGLWMKVVRGAAATQGAQIPPIKRLRPGFSRLRVLCGGQEVTPVHPFRLRSRVSETDAIDEGLYVFRPEAIGPQCGTVSLVLSSVKEPDKSETRVVGPAILRRIADDFAPAGSSR